MQRIIDFHSHILPNADHGCSDVREALRQLRLAKKFGTTDIVATPHFEPENDTVSSFLKKREEAVNALLPYLTAELPRVFVDRHAVGSAECGGGAGEYERLYAAFHGGIGEVDGIAEVVAEVFGGHLH